MASKVGKKKTTKKHYQSLTSYIRDVLKQIHPDTGIDSLALESVNALMMDSLNRIVKSANELAKNTHTHTVSSRLLIFAIKSVVPGELTKHAISECTKAVTKYQSSKLSSKAGRMSKASRAGLKFPPTRIGHMIRERASGCSRLSETASITMAATLEYLAAEVLELAGNSAYDHKHKLINNRDILLAISNDFELHKLYKNVVLPGGVVPFYIPTEKDKKKKRKK